MTTESAILSAKVDADFARSEIFRFQMYVRRVYRVQRD